MANGSSLKSRLLNSVPANTIDLDFADGSYTFALPLARIAELERKCGAQGESVGIGKIFSRVLKGCIQTGGEVVMLPTQGEFFAIDLIETIRQGLIGGARGVVDGADIKVTPQLAERLITGYVLDRPLQESWSMAASILGACIIGYDPPKKD
jgi:hypothetical protein